MIFHEHGMQLFNGIHFHMGTFFWMQGEGRVGVHMCVCWVVMATVALPVKVTHQVCIQMAV